VQRISLDSLYHGTHDANLRVLNQRPIRSHMTLGTWLSDFATAHYYGASVYKVISPKRYLKLKEFYSWDDVLEDIFFECDDELRPKDYKIISDYYQSLGFDGILLSSLDGIIGVFVCLWHDYPIKVKLTASTSKKYRAASDE
jgi:hypothetical protein